MSLTFATLFSGEVGRFAMAEGMKAVFRFRSGTPEAAPDAEAVLSEEEDDEDEMVED
jgi:hypothetical protein